MYDIIIIGGGPGGYAAAIRGAQLGAKVALIERDRLGGVCLNLGCIPAKTLLQTAKLFDDIKNAASFGIITGDPELDFSKMMARKERLINTLASGIQWLMKSNGVDLIQGNAELISAGKVTVNGKRIESRNTIIAVGSSPLKLNVPGVDEPSVITSDEIFSLEKLPGSMVIIGGGVIGIEMAVLFQALGCPTTIIEMMDRIAPMMDREISQVLTGILKRQGIKIITGARVEAIQKGNVTYKVNHSTQAIDAALVLMAVGRYSNGKLLPLDKIGIKHNQGMIVTDEYLRTNIPNIYAAGDVNGKYMLAHVASMEGIVAAEVIMGLKSIMDYTAIPQCIYTFPEVASVGMTEEQAILEGHQFKVSRFPVKSNGKSLAEGDREGFIKMLAGDNGQILGTHIIAPHATEMITQSSLVINLKGTVEDIVRTIFPHPTVSEVIHETAHGINGRAIHL